MKDDTILILVVDDDPAICRLAEHYLGNQEFSFISAHDGAGAVRSVLANSPDLVLMDIDMPIMDGIEALKTILQTHPATPVIMMSGKDDIAFAVEAMRHGAMDYVRVRDMEHELPMRVNKVVDDIRKRLELERLQRMLGSARNLCGLMGHSLKIRAIYEQITTVSRTDFTVVIYGESGSGKELVARAIHENSRRADGPFVPVDCGSIPESLIESELFGHERGAFTGAYERKKGSFERASGGTLFLDEIGNLPRSMQARFLRTLQERTVERVGGAGPIAIDIRIIVAGNQRLQDLITQGTFREDLFHRLNEFTIEIPPLRKRKEDMVYLAKRFVDETVKELNKEPKDLTISPQAWQLLESYDWPGNVRELRNVIRRAVLFAESGQILPKHLTALHPARTSAQLAADAGMLLKDIYVAPSHTAGLATGRSLRDMMREFSRDVEQQIISQALEKTGGNKSQAAKMLQVDYKTILTKITEYKLGPAPRARNQRTP